MAATVRTGARMPAIRCFGIIVHQPVRTALLSQPAPAGAECELRGRERHLAKSQRRQPGGPNPPHGRASPGGQPYAGPGGRFPRVPINLHDAHGRPSGGRQHRALDVDRFPHPLVVVWSVIARPPPRATNHLPPPTAYDIRLSADAIPRRTDPRYRFTKSRLAATVRSESETSILARIAAGSSPWANHRTDLDPYCHMHHMVMWFRRACRWSTRPWVVARPQARTTTTSSPTHLKRTSP